MGLHWQVPSFLEREGRPPVGLVDGPQSWWLHEIGQGMRLSEWNSAGTRRRRHEGHRIHSKIATIDSVE